MSSSPQQRYEVKGISSSSSEETVVVESVGKEHKNSLTWGVDGKEKIESKSEELSFRQKLKDRKTYPVLKPASLRDLDALFDLLLGVLNIDEHTGENKKKVKKSFFGHDLIKSLVELKVADSEQTAARIGTEMLGHGYFLSASGSSSSGSGGGAGSSGGGSSGSGSGGSGAGADSVVGAAGDGTQQVLAAQSLYVLQQDQHDSAVLNCRRLSSAIALTPEEVGEQLRKSILSLYGKYLSEDGRTLQLEQMKNSDEFFEYTMAAVNLQNTSPKSLTEEGKLAFFINVYNALMVHATAVLGPPTSMFARKRFFTSASYLIGGQRYTLDDVEHGVLRGNRKGPASFSRCFGAKDPRLLCSIVKFDPRIHFALVCGAKSCPPIKLYKPSNVLRALALAAMSFMDQEVVVEESKKTVHMSKIFSWYKSDFGASDKELLQWCAANASPDLKPVLEGVLKDGSFKISYREYDWSAMTV